MCITTTQVIRNAFREQISDPHDLIDWNWQSCTEMVMPMTITKESMFLPYNFSYEDNISSCNSTYGVTPRPHWITTEYGGLRIEQVLKGYGEAISSFPME